MRRALVALTAAAALVAAGRAAAVSSFAVNDPLAPRQWYLAQDRAFDFWPTPPLLPPVHVAIIDSGIDGSHPEFANRIADARSFVGGSPLTDQFGHGTFVAGVIAAASNNGVGIAGIAFPSQLIIAKVVRPDRTVSIRAEAAAIRWAVNRGARVINLSLGGLRDPRRPKRDTYSALEASALRYAVRRGVLVVAAVGNGDQSPSMPWPFASYPAALPHVLGVSAYGPDGNVPAFSNRDAIFNDISAPGQDIVSTLPRALTASRPACAEQGYSVCGPEDYRRAEGTSFAAPQVAAAAALLFSARPTLRPEQVRSLLERAAEDSTPANGCRSCRRGRDSLSGWGRLNIEQALVAAASPPPRDRFEPNDEAGSQALKLRGARADLMATVDFWDDQTDVYRVHLGAGQTLSARLEGPSGSNSALLLWKPGTSRVEGRLSVRLLEQRVAASTRRGWRQRVSYRARQAGWHYLQVKVVGRGSGPYRIRYTKS